MFFTQEDYRKIEKWLLANSRKDTDFVGAATPLKGNETVVLVQNGKNVKTSVKDIVDQFFLLGVSDFLNITDKYGESYISIDQAIQLIPFRSRKEGQVITFIDESGNWAIYQFQGKALNQWNNTTLWIDLLAKVSGIPLIDSEDITTKENGAKQVSLYLADKQYNEAEYSGLGKIYLRKNIYTVVDPSTGAVINVNLLTQSMLAKENTTYIIQYDYNLNKQIISIPEGSVLLFEGGSIDNGTINCNSTTIVDKFSGNATIVGTYSFQDAQADEEDITQNQSSVLKFKDRKYEPDKYSGLGRVILRKNIVEIDDPIYGKVTKNILFQDMIAQANTIYEIRYDYNLNGNTVTIPEGCILDMRGGSLTNGTINCVDTIIISTDASKLDVTLTGTYRFDSEKLVTSNTEDINISQSVDRKSHTISAMLADRDTTNGMGYVILRKNKSFAEQVTKENTIYEIRYDFNLNGSTFSIPNNCILKFEGGTLSNGILTGHVLNEYINPKWLGAKGNGITDDTIAIRNAIDICTKIVIPTGDYKITAQEQHVKEGFPRNAIWINTSNHYIKCEEGAVFHLSYSVTPAVGYNPLWGYFMGIAGTEDNYVENIVIEGGTWIGGRSLFPATPADKRIEEGSSAFFLRYTRNVTFKDCIITDNQGDSITIYRTKDFKAINVTSRYARRSGIAFGSSSRCIIENSHFVEDAADKYYGDVLSKGTAPYFAIEVDNDGDSPCENMIFRNNIFECTISPKGALLIVDETSIIQDVIFEGNIIHSKTSTYIWGVEITSHELVKNIQIINNRFYNSGERKDTTIDFVVINSDNKIEELNISGNYIENGNILYWHAQDSTPARDTFNINIDNNVSYSGVLLSGYPDAKTLNIRNNILQSATILNITGGSSYTTGIIRKILIQNNVTNVTESPLPGMSIYINFRSSTGTESFDIIGNTIKSSIPTTLYFSQFSKAVTYPIRFIGNKLDFKNGNFGLNQWSTFPGMLAQNVFISKENVMLTYSEEMAAPMKIINNIFEGSTVPFVSEEHADVIVQDNIFV